MPWFKVDDGFYDHPKVLEAGNAAVGLWLRCATWSARQLTDGHVPAAIARGYGTGREIRSSGAGAVVGAEQRRVCDARLPRVQPVGRTGPC